MNSHISMQMGFKTFPCTFVITMSTISLHIWTQSKGASFLKTLLFRVLLMEGRGFKVCLTFCATANLYCYVKQMKLHMLLRRQKNK